jgi:hypothetical protein
MDDELNLDELDNVSAGYSNAQMALQQKITTLEGYLKNPNNSVQEREEIYNMIEEAKNELAKYDTFNSGRGR